MYHRHGVSAKVFQSVDHAIFQALWRWAKRRHPNKGVRWVKARYFHTSDERHWVFSGMVRGSKGQSQTVHLFTAHSLPITRHSPPYTFFLLNGDKELNRNRHLFV